MVKITYPAQKIGDPMLEILFMLLVLAAISTLPIYPYSQAWGIAPASAISFVLFVFLVYVIFVKF